MIKILFDQVLSGVAYILIVTAGPHQDLTGVVFEDQGDCNQLVAQMKIDDATTEARCAEVVYMPKQK